MGIINRHPESRHTATMFRTLQRLGLCALFCLASTTALGSPCETVRSTTLYAQPSFSAARLVQLQAASRLDCGELRNGWQQVRDDSGRQGWVRRLGVRQFTATVDDRDSGSLRRGLEQLARAVTGLFGGQPRAADAAPTVTATLGIRSLDSNRNTVGDPMQLQQLDTLAAAPAQARAFAQAGGLTARSLETRP